MEPAYAAARAACHDDLRALDTFDRIYQVERERHHRDVARERYRLAPAPVTPMMDAEAMLSAVRARMRLRDALAGSPEGAVLVKLGDIHLAMLQATSELNRLFAATDRGDLCADDAIAALRMDNLLMEAAKAASEAAALIENSR